MKDWIIELLLECDWYSDWSLNNWLIDIQVGSEHSSSDADMSEEEGGKGSGQDSRSEMKEIKLLLSALVKQV